MKKNGFAVSGILYPLLILFFVFLILILTQLSQMKYRFERTKETIISNINGDIPTISGN